MAVFHSSQVEISVPFQTSFAGESGSVPDLLAGFVQSKEGCCFATVLQLCRDLEFLPSENYRSIFDSKVSFE